MRLEEERRRAASWERDYYSYEHRTPTSPLQKEYDILGCACDATNETLLKAYRAAAKKYHPDLLRAKGYSESIIQAATAKMSQINDAWAKIRKERKI